MKDFYSHAGEFKGRIIKPKLLIQHTNGVTNKALEQFSGNAQFDTENLREQMHMIGLYHDLGKYTPYFQDYLLKRPGYQQGEKSKLKQHAKFGAFVLYQKIVQKHGTQAAAEALLDLYIIVHHHADLSDFAGIKNIADDNNKDIFEKQLRSILSDVQQIAEEMNEVELSKLLIFPSGQDLYAVFKQFYKNERGIQHYFQINYLFSLLIEADKLDASETQVYTRKLMDNLAVEKRIQRFRENPGFREQPLRDLVRNIVSKRLDELNLEKIRLFTLTAPTGVGKTLTALDFALKLKSRVPSLEKAQIIYALPFINIIEQSLSEYQKVFDQYDYKILAHYQYADVFNLDKHSDDQEGNVSDYHQKAMSLDTWQADVVITSFVQLLHTLIGSRNKLLKKFNHFADSILILDEVQTLRLDLLPVVGAALYYLTKHLNTRVLLMTATKPEIMPLASRVLLKKEGIDEQECHAEELLTGFEDIFSSYKRTQIIPLLDITLSTEDAEQTFLTKIFDHKWQSDKSCLIVVNKVKRCIDLFDKVTEYLSEKGFQNPVYCLSTNIVPLHRQQRIEQIKNDLKAGFKPILISTQVVEAGVDLDFDMGFRDLGPIDSIVQVAGRINRQSDPVNPEVQHKPIYIIDFGDCRKIYGKTTDDAAKRALKETSAIPEGDYLRLVNYYFDDISVQGYDKSVKVFKAMKELAYSQLDDEFQVIEERPNTTSVFVLCDPVEESEVVLTAFRRWQDKADKEMTKEKFEEQFKKAFHQRIIAVPKWYTEHLEDLSKDIKLALPEHYNFKTGLIRDSSKVPVDKIFTLSL